MHNSSNFAVTVRALIIDKGELLMVKHEPQFNYYALPGGKLETGETLAGGMARELLEETNIQAQVGKLLIINEWVSPTNHRIEFFFWIHNGHDFRQVDTANASHGFELADVKFGIPTHPEFGLLPSFLQTEFPKILELGEDYPIKLIQST